jgi:3-hydroxyisobutyrate dehydrogenase
MKIAFIGLGVMGSSMAGHILKKGYELSVFNRSPDKCKPFENTKARIATSYADCANDAVLLALCVGDGNSVKEVLFGEHGAAATLRKGAIVVDHSTISPSEAEEVGRELGKRGIKFLDAPVTGGDIGAKNGTLTIFVGGDEEILEVAREILTCYGTKICYIGPNGCGQKMKAVNQVGSIGNVAVLGEMLAFGSHLGLDPALCVEVLQDGAAGSFVLKWLGPRIASGDFRPGFSVKHSLKDMNIVLSEAKKAGISLRLAPEVTRALDRVAELGGAEDGNQSVFRIVKDQK